MPTDLTSPPLSAVVRSARHRSLRRWFRLAGRDLPWRATREPWPILVSEVLLQQTQVARAIERWPRLVDEFPTPSAAADAGQAALVRAWAGLGYNRRAMALHRCAQQIVVRHGGAVPANLDDLLALDGIGPYTARAVLAFAFEQPVGVLDTNVGRVLARWQGRTLAAPEAQVLADAHVPRRGGWWWNQAVLDLGATICTRRNPTCEVCPARASCGWFAVGLRGEDPANGSAAVAGGQSRFEGSDRQGRGRLVASLRAGPVSAGSAAVALAAGWPDDPARAMRVLEALLRDGLAERSGRRIVLADGGREHSRPAVRPR